MPPPLLPGGGKGQPRPPAGAPGPQGAAAPAGPPAPTTVQAAAGAAHAPTPRPTAHISGRPHLIRSERTPVTPAGSRRPAHTERPAAAGRAAARPAAGG
ncbi:hypothetical protein OV450_8464 [Actinobacteria bacterium OV450]|nr:hypothetical protein OV450_8464 [Actinobacteria bacterium OV450]